MNSKVLDQHILLTLFKIYFAHILVHCCSIMKDYTLNMYSELNIFIFYTFLSVTSIQERGSLVHYNTAHTENIHNKC